MLNRIILMGRLTRDPELRHTQTGTPVASFSLAVDRDFKDKETGEKKADFINVVAWRSTAEFVSRYFTKGRMAVVEGRLQIRDYTDRNGNKRTAAEVVADNVYFGDSKRDADGGGYRCNGSCKISTKRSKIRSRLHEQYRAKQWHEYPRICRRRCGTPQFPVHCHAWRQ